MSGTWTREAVEALGPTINVPTAAAIFEVNPETVYAAIRRNEWTATRVLRLGRVIKLPTLDILRLLYAPEVEAAALVPGGASVCHHGETSQVKAYVNDPQPQSQCGCKVEPMGALLPLRQAT